MMGEEKTDAVAEHRESTSSSSIPQITTKVDAIHRHANTQDDKALKIRELEVSGSVEVTPAVRRSLLIKSCLLYLLMDWCYAIFFIDKTCVASAAVMGIRKDLDMKGQMFSWTSTSYFLGYLVAEIPLSMLLLKKCGPRWGGMVIFAWGVVTMCSAATQSYAGFIVCRVLLGAMESSIVPVFTVITSQWFPLNEHFALTMTWVAWNGFGVIFINSVGYGLFTRVERGAYAIAGWRILFLIIGLMTVLSGIVFFFVIPNDPSEAKFLKDEEKLALMDRIKQNQQGFGNREIKWYQIKEALTTDAAHTFLLFINVFVNCVNMGAMTTFQTVIINGIVKNNAKSLLMTMPGGAFQFVGCYFICVLVISGVMQNNRSFYMILGSLLNVMSCCLLAWGNNDAQQLVGVWLWNWVAQISYGGLLSNVMSNTAGHTKKIFVSGVILLGFSSGNMVGPQMFQADAEATGYSVAKRTIASLACVSLLLQVALLLLNVYLNKRRDKRNEKLPSDILNPEFADLTDMENPEFRYRY